MIQEMTASTGLAQVEIVRLAVKFALPKIQSGEVNLIEIGREA